MSQSSAAQAVPSTPAPESALVASRFVPSPSVLRPTSDVVRQWTGAPGSAASALDDAATQPASVPADDFIYGSVAGRVTEVHVTDVGTSGGTASTRAWFYANTGSGTQLRVDVVAVGAVRGTATVPAGSPFGWRSVEVGIAGQTQLNDLRIRFTSAGGGNTNVRAAYVQVVYVDRNTAAAMVSRGRDNLVPDQRLGVDAGITSLNGKFTLTYQGDGNTVLYQNNPGRDRTWLWDSGVTTGNAGYLILQGDGNLVSYDRNERATWASDTRGRDAGHLIVQNDGNLVLYSPAGQWIWDTETSEVLPGVDPGNIPRNVLAPATWKTVESGWFFGVYSQRYEVRIWNSLGQAPAGARYRCYVNGFQTSSGPIPGPMTFTMAPNGSCELYSPQWATFEMRSISSGDPVPSGYLVFPPLPPTG